MQVTVTGGTGQIAEFVIKELEKRKHSIVLFDRIQPGANRFQYEINHPLVLGDLANLEDCERAVGGSQGIIHLGGIPHPTDHPEIVRRYVSQGRTPYAWDETMRSNTMGTFYLLEAAKRAGVKAIVIASSNCVLGHLFRLSAKPFPISYLPVDETHPLDFEDSYSLSKLVNEETLLAYCRAYGIRGYALRPAGVWRAEIQTEHVKSYQPPTTWQDSLFAYVDIRDMARAFVMCLEAADSLPPFDAYYVNASDTRELEDSRSLVERLRPDLAVLAAGLVGRQALISPAKAEKAFGFRAEYSWTDLLRNSSADDRPIG